MCIAYTDIGLSQKLMGLEKTFYPKKRSVGFASALYSGAFIEIKAQHGLFFMHRITQNCIFCLLSPRHCNNSVVMVVACTAKPSAKLSKNFK